jgi:tRNA U34 5-methylaminomethyl-2-thiouridine-forming methyltransferase MnmC
VPERSAHRPVGGSGALLERRLTRDGSYSLWSARFGESFHSADGALREARQVFMGPAELERFPTGHTLTVVEVAVGTGTNTATLLEAVERQGLRLHWWGLELDPAPLAMALADERFRAQWSPPVLERLAELGRSDRLLWGDGRSRLRDLVGPLAGRCDLILLDAFSPRRCPELWSVEVLGGLARLLAPGGRLLTYSSAAAVRRALEMVGLRLAAVPLPASARPGPDSRQVWSAGTVASPTALPPTARLRPLSPMEREHMDSRAGEPYRDPSGRAGAAEILASRARAQAGSGAEPTSAWQRRWGIERRRGVNGWSPGPAGGHADRPARP